MTIYISENLHVNMPIKKDFYPKVCFIKTLRMAKLSNVVSYGFTHQLGTYFVFHAKLYGGTTSLATSGLNDWKNPNIVYNHDNNKEHINCLKQYLSRGTVLGLSLIHI